MLPGAALATAALPGAHSRSGLAAWTAEGVAQQGAEPDPPDPKLGTETGTQVRKGRRKADPMATSRPTAQHTVGTAADKPAGTVRAVIAAECLPHLQAPQADTSDSHSRRNAPQQPGDKLQRLGVPRCDTNKARRSRLPTHRHCFALLPLPRWPASPHRFFLFSSYLPPSLDDLSFGFCFLASYGPVLLSSTFANHPPFRDTLSSPLHHATS